MTSSRASCSRTCTCCGATEGMECQVTAKSSQQTLPSPAVHTRTLLMTTFVYTMLHIIQYSSANRPGLVCYGWKLYVTGHRWSWMPTKVVAYSISLDSPPMDNLVNKLGAKLPLLFARILYYLNDYMCLNNLIQIYVKYSACVGDVVHCSLILHNFYEQVMHRQLSWHFNVVM